MWLHANGIRMEHASEIVAEGKLIGETAYMQRAAKYTETELSYQFNKNLLLTCKMDFYDAKSNVVHEVKKSDSKEIGHEWQVKFYLWVLQQNGIENAKGIIEYPKLRETKDVTLTSDDIDELKSMLTEISNILQNEYAPGKIAMKYCKNCSYYEFCYINEI